MTTNQVAKKEESMSTRFMNAVVTEFTSGTGDLALTDFQKRLAQNYFMAIDSVLKATEERRQRTSEQYRDSTPVTWANVNMEALAQSVVSAARIGLDPMMPNHVYPIPFKNNKMGKYDINLMEGYRGKEIKAVKYGLNVPDKVIIEVVYSNDKFKPFKKDRNNPYDTFEFEITNPFDRGEVVGGFYYHIYLDNPEKNKLRIMSLKDILKRKPDKAAPEFWGGEKSVWKNGKKSGTEEVEGWFDEMVYKTIHIAAYKDITIDSQKIDDDYLRLKQIESSYAESEAQAVIDRNANSQILDIEAEVVDEVIQDAEFIAPTPKPSKAESRNDDVDFGDFPVPPPPYGDGPGF